MSSPNTNHVNEYGEVKFNNGLGAGVLNLVLGPSDEPVGKDEKYGLPIYNIKKEEKTPQQGIPNGLEVYQRVNSRSLDEERKLGKNIPKRDHSGGIVEINGEREEDFAKIPGGKDIWKKMVKDEEEKEVIRQSFKYKMFPWMYDF